MKNIFYVSGYRFHTKDKNKFFVMGYSRENFTGNERLSFYMDGEELSCEVSERQMSVVEFKIIEGKYVTKEYYFWIQLPPQWDKYKNLQVFYCRGDQKEHVLTVSCDELLKRKHDIPRSIDEHTVTKEGFHIKGWYITEKETSLHFFNMKGHELDMKFRFENRADVLKAYPENTENEVVGFIASYTGQIPKRIIVRYKREGKHVDVPVELVDSKTETIFTKSKEILHKTKAYYRHF